MLLAKVNTLRKRRRNFVWIVGDVEEKNICVGKELSLSFDPPTYPVMPLEAGLSELP
jgi:hypothetical protein